MGLFDRFSPRVRPFQRKAKELVPTAHLWTAGLLSLLVEKFPDFVLPDRGPGRSFQDWRFPMTVAAVSVAAKSLARRVPEHQFEDLYKTITYELGKFDRDAPRFFNDAILFVERSVTSVEGARPEQALGMWVLWNLYGRMPTLQEAQMAQAIGGLAAGTFWE